MPSSFIARWKQLEFWRSLTTPLFIASSAAIAISFVWTAFSLFLLSTFGILLGLAALSVSLLTFAITIALALAKPSPDQKIWPVAVISVIVFVCVPAACWLAADYLMKVAGPLNP